VAVDILSAPPWFGPFSLLDLLSPASTAMEYLLTLSPLSSPRTSLAFFSEIRFRKTSCTFCCSFHSFSPQEATTASTDAMVFLFGDLIPPIFPKPKFTTHTAHTTFSAPLGFGSLCSLPSRNVANFFPQATWISLPFPSNRIIGFLIRAPPQRRSSSLCASCCGLVRPARRLPCRLFSRARHYLLSPVAPSEKLSKEAFFVLCLLSRFGLAHTVSSLPLVLETLEFSALIFLTFI